MRKVLAAVVCCALALHAGPAEAEKRLALSIGIDVYDSLPDHEQLKKAVNDARAIGAAFRGLGFDVTVEENVTRIEFARAWQKFLNRLQPGDTAALFFAGHGVEIGGLNYLLPRDVPRVEANEDKLLAKASIRFNELMDELRKKEVRVALFIIDACRDNPFRDSLGRSAGGTRGLAVIEPARGSFVMYSAGAGEKALDRLPGDDGNPNSVYTRALLPILAKPGLSLPEIAGRVREEVVEVARRAGREQTPAYYDQLVGKFVLKAALAVDAKPGEAAETARICREVEGMSNPATLAVLERQHKGTPAGECVASRLKQLHDLAVVVSKPDPVPPKVVEPVAAVEAFNPARAAKPLLAAEERALKPGHSFRECQECPEMVVVPAGSFMMGSPASEEVRTDNEGPQRRVTIARPFAVGKFEVTFAEWDACVVAGGCKHRLSDEGWGRGRRPVINVIWDDITKEYMPWLSRKTGKTYRLLTEAEWEYAARAGSTTRYHFGDSERDLCTYGNVANLPAKGKNKGWTTANCRDGHVTTAPVGSFRPNAFGLHDTHGNVWEWVQDCWSPSYNGARSDGSASTAGDCSLRVLRGGSWFIAPRGLRSATRVGNLTDTDIRVPDIGFRVGRTL